MSNQHKLLPNSELHVPKDFEPAVAGQQAWKDEREQYSWETRFELPPVLGVVDNTVAPPTEVDGDIYIIDNTGASHPDWDGATANSWVRYNAADDAWNEVDEAEGMFVYDKATGDYYFFDGSAWVAFGGGVGSSTLTGLTDTPANYSGAANRFLRVNAGATATEFVAASAINISTFNNDAGFTADQTSIVGITGTKAQFDTAVTDGNILYVGDSQTLATGVSDVTATASEVNLLDLAGLTAGWVLSADSATTASWKAPAGGDTGNILDTDALTMSATRTHTLTNAFSLRFENSDGSPNNLLTLAPATGLSSKVIANGIVQVNTTTASGGLNVRAAESGTVFAMVVESFTGGRLIEAINNTGGTITRLSNGTGLQTAIGAISPVAKLHVKGTAAANTLRIDTDNINYAIYVNSADVVGINTGSPSAQLHVVGQASGAGSTPLLVQITGAIDALKVDTLAKTIFTVPTTGTASINLPHGVAPTSPVNGDMWTTTSSVFARINGSTVDLGGGGADTGNILDTATLTMSTSRTHTLNDNLNLIFANEGTTNAHNILLLKGSATAFNVGIGTASPPSENFKVKGTAGIDPVRFESADGTDYYQLQGSNGVHRMYSNGFQEIFAGLAQVQFRNGRVIHTNTISTILNDVGIGVTATGGTRLKIRATGTTDGIEYQDASGDVLVRLGSTTGGARLHLYDTDGVNRHLLYESSKLALGSGLTASAKFHIKGDASGTGSTPLRVDTSSIDNALLVNSSGHISTNGTASASFHHNGVAGISPFRVDYNGSLLNAMVIQSDGKTAIGGDHGAFDGLPNSTTTLTVYSQTTYGLRLYHATGSNMILQSTGTTSASAIQWNTGAGAGTFRCGINYRHPSNATNPNRLQIGQGAVAEVTLESVNIVRCLVNSSGIDVKSGNYLHGGTKVVGARQAGWGAPTGTATRTTFATSTVTTEQLAERLHGLIDDLTTHGMIGA